MFLHFFKNTLCLIFFAERPDPPTALEVIEIGSRSIRLSWRRSFDGNSPIRNYVIQYRAMIHGGVDEWDPSKTHNVTFTPGSSGLPASANPTSNGKIVKRHMVHFLSSRIHFYQIFLNQESLVTIPTATIKKLLSSLVYIQLLLTHFEYLQ